jgi:hypothetical protein
MKQEPVADELLSTLQFRSNFNNLIFAGDFNRRMDANNHKKRCNSRFYGRWDNKITLMNEFPYKYTYACHNMMVIFAGKNIKPKRFHIEDFHVKKH